MAALNKAESAGREIRSIGDLASGRSPVHDLAPLAKLLMTVAYILITVSFGKYDLTGLFVMLLFPVIGYAFSFIPVRLCFYKMRYVLPLVLMVGLFNPLLDRRPLAQIGAVAVSAGAVSMITLMLKGVFALMAAFLLAATTTPEALAGALRQLHVPKTLTALFLLTFRYVDVLLKEVAVMTDAYHLRAPRQKGIAFKAWGSFLGQLILRSADRAAAIFESMELRGFKGEFYYADRNASSGARSAAVAVIAIALMILMRFVNIPAAIAGWL